MSSDTSELTLESVTGLLAVVGGLLAAGTALWQMHENRQQRIKELRWRQASEGRRLIDELNKDEWASAAMRMIDWSRRNFVIDGVDTLVERAEVLWGLRITDLDGQSGTDVFVRDCFDSFFFHVHRTEQAIRNELTTFEDVKFPLDYYGRKMSRQGAAVYAAFMHEYGYTLAADLFTVRLGLPFTDPRPPVAPAAAEETASN